MSPQVVLPGDILNTAAATRWMPTPGEYVLLVDECREEANSGDKGGSRLVVINKVQSGPGASVADAGKTIYSSYQLSQDGMKYLRRFIEATGTLEIVAANGGRLDTDWFTGKRYACRVSIRKEFPNVSDERPVGEASVRGGQAQAQAAPSMLAPVQPPPMMQQPMMQQPGMVYPQQPGMAYPPQQMQQPQQYAQQPQMPAFPSAPQQPTVAVPPPPPGYGQGQGR